MRISGAKDFRSQWKRTRRRQGKRFKEGFYPSVKNQRDIHYRSGYELKVYKILEKAFSVKAYQGEPFAIPYYFGGCQRSYWPDILVIFTDDSQMLIEVKPLSQCPDPDGDCDNMVQAQNEAKWLAANDYCRQRGWLFVVWTERAIEGLARLRSESLTKAELTR